MKKTGKVKQCPICSNNFYAPKWLEEVNGAKYCSRKCYYKSKIGKDTWNKGTKGLVKKNKGSFLGDKVKFIGELKEYKALHHWVRKNMGSPTECSRCHKVGRIEWANKSGNYLKDVNDWIALCRPCHFIYDKTEKRRSKWH